LFTLTFAYFIGNQAPLKLPGAPFLLAALLNAIGIADRRRATLASGNTGDSPRGGRAQACAHEWHHLRLTGSTGNPVI